MKPSPPGSIPREEAAPMLVSCLMVTAARADRFRWIVASIASYLQQIHVPRELVIVLDQPAPPDARRIEAHVGSLHRSDIRIVSPPGKQTLGALRNLAMDSALGDLICNWDDDDLHHPRRIEVQLAHLHQTGAGAVCLSDCLHLFMNEGRCYWVNWALTRSRGLPGTLLARRNHGLRYPESGRFADRGEDSHLLHHLAEIVPTRFLAAPPFLYVYRFHGTNTFHREHHARLAARFCEGGARLQSQRAELTRCLQAFDLGLDETEVVDGQGVAFRVGSGDGPPASPTYHRGPFGVVPVGREQVLASATELHEPTLLHRRVSEIVTSCSPFATLEEHARRLCRDPRQPGLTEAAALAGLQEAAARGLLVSADQVLRAGAAPAADGPPIRSIGVVTKGRPDALVRCLVGFSENLRSSGRSAQLTVVDSTQQAGAGHVREAVQNLESQLQTPIRYVGLAEKTTFARDLVRAAGVDPRLAEFALLGLPGQEHDVGANRNAMILLHAGGKVFCADDDMVCDLRGPAAEPDAVSLTGEESPVPVTLYRTFEDARAALAPRPGCVLDLHEQRLGHTVTGALAGTPPGQIRLGSFPLRLLTSLLRGEGRVVASFGGYYGDSGASYPAFFLWSGPTVRHQVTGGLEDYRALVDSRQMTRLAPLPTITGGRFSMCGHSALDCRTLLPAFFPNLRGEDHLFGQLLRGCFEDALFAHVPQAIAHRPWETRGPHDRRWDPRPGLRMMAVVGQALDMAELSAQVARSGERRLRMLGRGLREIALLPAPDFRELMRKRVSAAVARMIARSDQLIEEAGGTPAYWVADLHLHRDHLLEVLANPDRDAPVELLAGRDAPAASALLQQALERYGSLLEVWPELFEAARQLTPT
jgi:hypothetical protein